MKTRCVTIQDSLLLRSLAQKCEPLDVHTPYTYWVVCRFYGESCYVLEKDNEAIGYIMAIVKDDTLFVWQIGILKDHRQKKYSKYLLEAVYNYAVEHNMSKIQVSIAPDNANSYNAFKNFFKRQNLTLVHNGEVDIQIPSENLKEYEYIYDIIL